MYYKLFILFFIVLLIPWIYLHAKYDRKTLRFIPENNAKHFPETTLVLGAGLQADGSPSKVLADRLETTWVLYQKGKIKKILLSGKKVPGYNESLAMKNWMLQKGVPENVLELDEQGYRTIHSCQNAKSVYKLNEVLVITQNFHLYRALYLCNKAGLKTSGFIADIGPYSLASKLKWNIREIFAAWRALWNNT